MESLGLKSRGIKINPRKEERNVLFPTMTRPALYATQPRMQWLPGALSMETERPKREAIYHYVVSK